MRKLLITFLPLIALSCAPNSPRSGCEWNKPLYFYGQPEGTTKEEITGNLKYDPEQKIWYSTKYDVLTYETETDVLSKNKTYEDICPL